MNTRILTQQKQQSSTRVVHRTDVSDTSTLKLTFPALKNHEASRNEDSSERFQGFGSPPGRF